MVKRIGTLTTVNVTQLAFASAGKQCFSHVAELRNAKYSVVFLLTAVRSSIRRYQSSREFDETSFISIRSKSLQALNTCNVSDVVLFGESEKSVYRGKIFQAISGMLNGVIAGISINPCYSDADLR